MSDNNFIPTLDVFQHDKLTEHIDKIAYLVGFTLINPGFTSDNFEHKMLSLGAIVAKYPNKLNDAAAEYEKRLQELINIECTGETYSVSVTNQLEDGTDAASRFVIIVVDSKGNNMLRENHMIDRLKIGT